MQFSISQIWDGFQGFNMLMSFFLRPVSWRWETSRERCGILTLHFVTMKRMWRLISEGVRLVVSIPTLDLPFSFSFIKVLAANTPSFPQASFQILHQFLLFRTMINKNHTCISNSGIYRSHWHRFSSWILREGFGTWTKWWLVSSVMYFPTLFGEALNAKGQCFLVVGAIKRELAATKKKVICTSQCLCSVRLDREAQCC